MIRRPLAAIALTLLLAAPACADAYSDFRIPDHRLFSWIGTASSELNDRRDAGPAQSSTASASNARFTSTLQWFRDSDSRRASWIVRAGVDGASGRSRDERVSRYLADPGNPLEERLISQPRNTLSQEYWSMELQHRGYPWRAPVGWQVGLSGSGNYRQDWQNSSYDRFTADSSSRLHRLDLNHQEIWGYQNGLAVDVRWGFGKVRDVTGVLEARILEQRLRERGVITRDLSPTARAKLAALAYARDAYSRIHDRPGPALWQAVDELLRDDGALGATGIDAVSSAHAVQPFIGGSRGFDGSPFPDSPITRQAGFFVGPTFAARHSHTLTRRTQQFEGLAVLNDTLQYHSLGSYSSSYTESLDDAFAGVGAEFHRPLGDRWQVDATHDFSVPIRRGGRHTEGFRSYTDGRVSVVVADRWLGSGYAQHTRTVSRDGGAGQPLIVDDWAVSYGGGLTMYLVDRVQARLDLHGGQARIGFYQRSHRDSGALFTLTYRLAGRATGAGLPLQ